MQAITVTQVLDKVNLQLEAADKTKGY
jgi:hypothetical protein